MPPTTPSAYPITEHIHDTFVARILLLRLSLSPIMQETIALNLDDARVVGVNEPNAW